MKPILAFILAATIGAAALWVQPNLIGDLAAPALTRAEINACALMVAREDYRRQYDWATKTWVPNAISQEDADQSLIVDNGLNPDFVAIADSYSQYDRVGLETVFRKYVNEGTKRCIAMMLHGEKIEAPVLKVRDGYHVVRWNGSAELVKNGDPDPVFGCIDGYHPTGTGCIRD